MIRSGLCITLALSSAALTASCISDESDGSGLSAARSQLTSPDEDSAAGRADEVAATKDGFPAEDAIGAVDASGTSPAAVPASCQYNLGSTFRSGNTIIGFGNQSNCGTSGVTYLTIQRSRWYGWEDLKQATVVGSGHDVYVGYNCSGTGTHTFRTIQTGRTVGGDPIFKESNHIRETCN